MAWLCLKHQLCHSLRLSTLEYGLWSLRFCFITAQGGLLGKTSDTFEVMIVRCQITIIMPIMVLDIVLISINATVELN